MNTYLLYGVIVVVFLYIGYVYSGKGQLKCIIASKDGNIYCVRKSSQMKRSANLLATVTAKMTALVAYLKRTHPHDPRVIQLVKNYNPQSIQETLPTSQLTAYSENKGESISFCVTKEKMASANKPDDLIDIHTLTFVALHELSHLLTESIGHKQDFWQNFKFILNEAKKAHIYNPIDYKKRPTTYCGMKIADNPYYDLR